MNMKKLLFSAFILLINSVFSQNSVQLYSSDFEAGTPLTYDQQTINTWIISTCAGNGGTQAGTNALYVSKGGVNPGCGTDGQEQYAFDPAPPSATERMTAHTAINGTCSRDHSLTFDYKFNPSHTSNRAFVVYSLNGGAFWFVQDTLPTTATWTQLTVNLDEDTYNSNFLVGFRFEYSNASGAGDPLAVDNITVNGIHAGANIQQDTIEVCNQTTLVISADPSNSGTGLWFVESGQCTINNPNAPQTGINNLAIGTTVLSWTVTSGTCGTSSDTLVIINSLAPSFANVQDTMFACGTEVLNISTSSPSAGTGIWTTSGGITISAPNSPATVLTTIPGGWNQVIWTVSSPGCPSNSDTMNIFKGGGQAILSADTSFCFGTDPTLLIQATTIDSLQTLNWMFATGNGTITNPDSTTIEVSNLIMGENSIIYTVTHTLCPTEKDTILINVIPCEDFDPVFPTVITPNGDGKNDVFVVYNLEKIYPNCQMTIYNRWGNVVFESTGYASPWDGTFKGEKLPMGTYFFKLELNDGQNTVHNGPISIIH